MTATLARRRETIPRRRRAALWAVGFVVLWLAIGFLRGPALGADAMAAFENPRLVTAVTTTTFPAIPPFMLVQVQATVTEPGGAFYTSAQLFLVEPFTGWTVNLSSVGLAPSA